MRRRTNGLRMLIGTMAMTVVPALMGGPVQYLGNNHWYEGVLEEAGITWQQASAAAVARGGYLATISSSGENAFAYALASGTEYWIDGGGVNYLGPWLGGYQYDKLAEPGGHWRWVTEEPWGVYTSWQGSNPNNYNNNEDYLHFYNASYPHVPASLWNDLPSAIGLHGYVIEWDSNPLVPEPAAITLLGTGCIAMGVMRRRRPLAR